MKLALASAQRDLMSIPTPDWSHPLGLWLPAGTSVVACVYGRTTGIPFKDHTRIRDCPFLAVWRIPDAVGGPVPGFL